MSAKIIDGKAFAANLRARVGTAVAEITARHALTPGLDVVLVGDDPASQVYVRNKVRDTAAAGMHSREHRLPAETQQSDLLALIDALNNDPAVHGILVQMPLPRQIDANVIVNAIDPAKDVDGLHPVNAGRLAQGLPALVPCTPQGALMLIKDTLGEIAGADALVIGRSILVGRPMAQLLLAHNATVTIAHSKTRDLAEVCRRADIVVAAIGKPGFVRGGWLKPGACVIDVGINRIDQPNGKTRLVGDVAFDEAVTVAGSITPVPGGVGPMTIACLLRNTVLAACAQNGVKPPTI